MAYTFKEAKVPHISELGILISPKTLLHIIISVLSYNEQCL